MWANRVSPSPRHDQLNVPMSDSTDWDADKETPTGTNANGDAVNRPGSTVRRRPRRSFDAGTEEYASYVEKRVFHKRHAYTPYLWERKRDKRLLGNLNPTRGWEGWKFRQKMRWNSIKFSWREWTDTLEVWRDSLKRIEGFQGTGVVSYFVLLKFLLFLNIFIFLAMFFCVVLFQVAFDTTDFSKATTGLDNATAYPGLALAANCTERYVVNETSGFQEFLDIVEGTGWMEKTAFFYGYYSNTEVTIPGSTYNMPLAYFLTTMLILIISLFILVQHTVSKYLDTLITVEDARNKSKFFFLILCNWDYRVCGENPTKIQQKSVYNTICSEIEEYRHELRKRLSSRLSRCLLWTVRIVVNIFILILLGGAAAAIYKAQEFSINFKTSEQVEDYHMMVQLLVAFLPSIIMAILNGGFPLLFAIIVKLEKYKPSAVLRITILRTVFVRLASLIVITITIYNEIVCSTRDECLVGTGDCPQIMCWETYFGQQIYKLMVTEIAVDLLITFVYELPRKLITTKCGCGIAKKIGPAVFDVPINVLDLVYAQALTWLGFFFAPLLPAMSVVRLIILFYLRKLSALFNTVPPERPYQAARSNAFFLITLLVTFFLITIPVGYVLVKLEPSPMCGPFRIYANPSDIVQIKIDTGDSWFVTIWSIVTSSAFVTLIIIILMLALYYCSAVKSANSRMITMLKGNRLQDEKDKQFLLLRLSEYTNEFKADPPVAPKPRAEPTIRPVDNVIEKKKFDDSPLHNSDYLPNIPEKVGSPKGLVIQVDKKDM